MGKKKGKKERESSPPSGAPIKGGKRQGGKADRRKPKREYALVSGGDDLGAELARVGLRVKEVAADGNCFFRSLCDQTEGERGDHLQMRARVVGHIEANREAFEPFVEDDEPFDKYVARMAREGTWAGHLELQAASAVLEADIRIYQAGQPVWSIKHSEGAPCLHLSYHDEIHWNSVRDVDDYGSGPPAPIRLAAAAADPAAVAARQRSWGERELARVAAGTSCEERQRLEAALAQAGGNVDAAIEWLIEQMGEEQEGGGSGVLAAAGEAAGASGVAAADTQPEDQQQQQQQQDGQRQQEGQRLSISGRGAAAAGAQRVLVRLRPAAGSGAAASAVSVELEVVTGAAGEPPCSSSSGMAAAAGDMGRQQEQEQEQEQEQQSPGNKKKGVRLRGRGKDGAAAAPNRNKPCPCGSGVKYKHCCAKKKRSEPVAARNGEEEGGGSAAGAAAQLAELFI